MRHLTIFLFLIISLYGYGQEGLCFSSSKNLYLKGNSTIIGNNIVGVDATKPYNDHTKINDELKMQYVDIDNNPSTFSSSQANLTLPENPSKIKYAALYWSAIYKYNKGVKRVINNEEIVYKGKDIRDTIVSSILLKQPNGKYQPLNGHVVYDSYKTKLFEDTKPYVCYANVTNLLKNANNVNGTYTVANIKATEGYVSGGAAGGWLLYVVYEEETASAKYFTTYNGFVGVDRTATDIYFEDFKTNENGEIKSSLLIGTLEGDYKFKTDDCAILNANKNMFVQLKSKQRPEKNFFNSKITIEDKLFLDRNPKSTNTLGFDVFKMKIPNENNQIISNNSSEATIRFKTRADGFYLFFVAFETEINPNSIIENKIDVVDKVEVEVENIEAVEEITTEIKEKETTIEKPVIPSNTKLEETKKPKKKKKSHLERIESLKSIQIPNLEKGYYLVTNVFSEKENADKWMKTLEEKGHAPKSYINPKNKWHYIYLDKDENASVIINRHKEISKLDYFEGIWILKINF